MITCTPDCFVRDVCVCVCAHDNLKTIAVICFLLGSYIYWRKTSDKFTCQDCRWRSRSFFGGFKVTP